MPRQRHLVASVNHHWKTMNTSYKKKKKKKKESINSNNNTPIRSMYACVKCACIYVWIRKYSTARPRCKT